MATVDRTCATQRRFRPKRTAKKRPQTSERCWAESPSLRRQQAQAGRGSHESGQHVHQKINGAELREYQPEIQSSLLFVQASPHNALRPISTAPLMTRARSHQRRLLQCFGSP